MVLELTAKKEDLKTEFERMLDVLSIALNRGITDNILDDISKIDHGHRSHLWMYQKNGSCSDYENFDRVDLKPCMNDYWLFIANRSETSIIFSLTFRYAKQEEEEDIFSKMLLYLFSGNLRISQRWK